MKKNTSILLSMFSLLLITTTIKAQSNDTATNKRIVESKNYIFKPQTVSPPLVRNGQLTGEYELVVSGDSIISYLPYFGRAYTAPAPSSDGGIKFTSTKHQYNVKTKKNSWEITILPTDAGDVQQLFLDIFNNGTASLRVISLNRQSISFNGYIIEGNPKAKKAF